MTPVDSSVPPPPAPVRGKLRPWYLVAAMVLTWFIGVHGLNVGFGVASLLRGGSLPDATSAALHTSTVEDVWSYGFLQQARSLTAHPRTAFPLAVAQVLLSGLLVVASGLAMGGRRGARSLALQALGANALLVVASFALTPFQRAAFVEGCLQAVESVGVTPADRSWIFSPFALQWIARVRLVFFDLSVLGLGALALTRPRTKTFFEAVSRATEGPEEP